MKYLITGINGFVGPHLSEFLLKKHLNIIGTIYPENAEIKFKQEIPIYPCNLTTPADIKNIIQKTKPEYIFHLAGQSFVPLSWQNPAATIQINVLGTLYLLDAVKNYIPKTKILLVGSGEEYGSSTEGQTLTEETPLNPENPYALSKTYIDSLSAQLGKYYGLRIIRTRSFPHIGPGQSPNFVVSDFCRQIALIEKQKQLPILKVGNLKSKRDFTDVRDIVSAYWLALKKGIPGNVYNISSEKLYSIKEILDKLINISSTKIRIQSTPGKFRPTDTKIVIGNSQKFRDLTGWQPKISLDQSLQETLDWWRTRV